MDFGTILDKWEKKTKINYPVKDISGVEKPVSSLNNLKKMNPQAVLDLHGFTAREAEAGIEDFISRAREQGLVKIMIIHGKGNNSSSDPVLKRVAMETIRNSPYTGLTGIPGRKLGGSGAVWVLLKNSDRLR